MLATKNVRFFGHIFYCKDCNIPIIINTQNDNAHFTQNNNTQQNLAHSSAISPTTTVQHCPLCKKEITYLTTDLRPVFPQERLLLEFLLKKEPFTFASSSVWNSANRYYIDSKTISISTKNFIDADTDLISQKLSELSQKNLEISKAHFDAYIQKFILANKTRFNFIKDEAFSFVQETIKNFTQKNKCDIENSVLISFSGGKDSTCTADVVIKALGDTSITHIFGDTTLELPQSYEYVERYKNSHPLTEFRTAKNTEQNFYKVAEDIGPPARMMRWCCSMFKTGPITRILNRKYGNKQILTFYGIRSNESVARSKYTRISENTENVKIQKQTVASPIFYWKDVDVWLYLLSENVDFNDAYRLGYDRVGCWCCPNNNTRAQVLSKIYQKELFYKWRTFLIDFAKSIGKPDAAEYVDSGKWKARQGGNGVKASGDVKLKFTACTSEEHAKIYNLTHAFDDSFLTFFIPFGKVSKELGRKLINETLVLDKKTNVPIIAITPFNQDGFEHAVKIKTMNVANHDDLQRMIGYQVRKFNACRKCLKCESVCRQGAISIINGEYIINEEKCVQCKMCVNQKYLTGGCMMEKYLRTKD